MTNLGNLPVAVIGGGPVGLAAAAHLVSRGIPVKLYEAGAQVGTNLRDWGHVRVFTPWRYCVDTAARKLLESHGWRMPVAEAFPTGVEIVGRYVAPLASLPELAPSIETNARRRDLAMGSRQGPKQGPGRQAIHASGRRR